MGCFHENFYMHVHLKYIRNVNEMAKTISNNSEENMGGEIF